MYIFLSIPVRKPLVLQPLRPTPTQFKALITFGTSQKSLNMLITLLFYFQMRFVLIITVATLVLDSSHMLT